MKLGIALSGGGIRGIAHAGVLKALEENDIKVDMIGGTSSGGLIASLYAMGYSPMYIYYLFEKYADDIMNFSSIPIVSGIASFMSKKKNKFIGLKLGNSIEKSYNELANKKGIKNISDIKMPLVIPAVDIADSKEYVFTNYIPQNSDRNINYINNINIGKAVRASSSFPGIFFPCDFKKHKFLDGGVLDNIPVKEVKKQGATKVIAVNFKADDIDENSNVMDIAMRTIDIMGNKISEKSLNSSDFILTIQTDKTGLLDTNKIESCYKYGYEQTMANMEKIKKVIDGC